MQRGVRFALQRFDLVQKRLEPPRNMLIRQRVLEVLVFAQLPDLVNNRATGLAYEIASQRSSNIAVEDVTDVTVAGPTARLTDVQKYKKLQDLRSGRRRTMEKAAELGEGSKKFPVLGVSAPSVVDLLHLGENVAKEVFPMTLPQVREHARGYGNSSRSSIKTGVSGRSSPGSGPRDLA